MRTKTLSLVALSVLLAFLAAPSANADDIAFGFTYGGDIVGRLDLTTGQFTQIGPAQPTAYAGIGMVGGNVYAGQYSCLFCVGPSPFYTIDETTGVATPLGTSNSAIFAMGSTSGGGLFDWDRSGLLATLNPSNGIATPIGFMSCTFGCASVATMSSWGPNLYITLGQNLYLVDTLTAGLTLIGNTGQSLTAIGFINGTLYGMNVGGGIYSLNPTNGAATFVSSTSAGEFAGIVPFGSSGAPVPEPASLVLLGTGLLAIARGARRKWHK